MKLFVASTNAGKLRDFAHAASGRATLLPLPGLEGIEAPAEDEDSFEGNAAIKALYYSRFAPGELVVADDSGLEVDALGGAPGVRSARYAADRGFEASGGLALDERNNLCLMKELAGVLADERAARYRCALVVARNGKVVCMASGAVEGMILLEPTGSSGFGYDPLFLPVGGTKTMAELDLSSRMALSHRGRALSSLLEKLAGL